MFVRYHVATEGLPMTERVDLYDTEMVNLSD
jgi:hypothetical protein